MQGGYYLCCAGNNRLLDHHLIHWTLFGYNLVINLDFLMRARVHQLEDQGCYNARNIAPNVFSVE